MTRSARITSALLAAALTALLASGVVACRRQTPSGPPPEPAPTVWPLTGIEAPSEDAVRARVVSVKIENSRAARPQTGLGSADVVYELLTEGGITRFHALYHSQTPSRVGPVRSARPPDIRIVREYDSILVFSGANRRVLGDIEEAGIDDLPESAGGEAFERSTERRAPHNLYVDVTAVREAAAGRGYDTEAEVPSLEFGAAPSEEGTTGTAANVPFNASNQVVWNWNTDAGRYERQLNGEPHADEGSDTPYAAANVIVLFAEVIEGERPGTTDVRVNTSGDAIVYRGGMRFDASWTATRERPPRFTTASGAELPLAAGKTWFEVVPASERSRFE